MEKFAFGPPRRRWSNHLGLYPSEALCSLDERDRAMEQADKALRQGRGTGSLKYQGNAHALRGQLLLEAGRPIDAQRELPEALTLARRIGYPTLTWQAAHLLALVDAAAEDMEQVASAARLTRIRWARSPAGCPMRRCGGPSWRGAVSRPRARTWNVC